VADKARVAINDLHGKSRLAALAPFANASSSRSICRIPARPAGGGLSLPKTRVGASSRPGWSFR
jgi:hypothetical protein